MQTFFFLPCIFLNFLIRKIRPPSHPAILFHMPNVYFAWQHHLDRWSEQTHQKHWPCYRCEPWHCTVERGILSQLHVIIEMHPILQHIDKKNSSDWLLHYDARKQQILESFLSVDIRLYKATPNQTVNSWNCTDALHSANKQLLPWEWFSPVNNTVWSRFKMFLTQQCPDFSQRCLNYVHNHLYKHTM